MAGRARESAPLVVVWSLCTALVVPTGCAGAGDDKPATDGVHTGDSGAGNGGTDGGGGSAGSDDPIDTGDTGDTGTPGSGIGLPVEWDAADFLHVWDIGPGHPYETPGDAPWETLSASTLVRIHARSEPYTDKFVVAVTGTAVGLVSFLGYTPDIFFGPLMGVLLDNSPGITGHQHLFWVLTAFAVLGAVVSVAFERVAAAAPEPS